MTSVFIVAAKRTPFGAFGGKLAGMTATAMQVHASKAALAEAGLKGSDVDSVIIGNVIQSDSGSAYLARHVGLQMGADESSTALTLNRLCGSGFQTIINGAQEIMLGEASIVMTGGAESMSQAPFAVRDMRFGHKFGSPTKFEDTLWSGLTDAHAGTPMAITAENLAEKYGITRAQCDAFALQSQQRWAAANEAKKFAAEIAPIELKSRKGPVAFDFDEHARPQTTAESLAKLPPVFKKDGTVTGGTASGIADGAGAVLLASEEAVKKHGLKPLARVAGWGISGCPPQIMGIGPVPAIKQALARAGKQLADMDLVEVNEAFAAQFLAVQKELGLDDAVTNKCGGAIAIGHPLGASGSRIMGHLTHQLHAENKQWALGAACIGGGQGIAVLLEATR